MNAFELTYPSLADNLALDEALLTHAEEANAPPLLRIWEHPRLAVVLGASGRVDTELDLGACEAEGIEIGRRSSGGGTVVLGPGALNVAVVLSIDAEPAYLAVDTAQVHVLETIATTLRHTDPDVVVCGSGDLVRHDRKVAGSAQRRLRRRFLIHATILYDFPLDVIPRLLREPPRQPPHRRGRSHLDFVDNLAMPRDVLRDRILEAWTVRNFDSSPPTDAILKVGPLASEKIGRDDWIFRL